MLNKLNKQYNSKQNKISNNIIRIVDKSSAYCARDLGSKSGGGRKFIFVSLCIYMFCKKDRNK